MKNTAFWTGVVAVAASAVLPARGDTYTVAEGETQTLDSITNTAR